MNLSQIDYSQIIISTLNSVLSSLFSSIDNTLYSLLDEVVFIDSSIVSDSFFDKAFGSMYHAGILIIADSLFFGFLIYYCIRLHFSFYSGSNVEKPLQFTLKCIVLGICINCSQFLCEQIVYISSALSDSIRDVGLLVFGSQISFDSLIQQINSFISTDSLDIFSFDGIIKGFVSFGMINLLFSYSLRYVLIKVFILLSPFAFLSLTNLSTSWFFKTWLKNFLALLLLQSFVSIIFLIVFSFDGTFSSTFSQLMYVGTLYALSKANHYMKELIGGLSTDITLNINTIKSFFK